MNELDDLSVKQAGRGHTQAFRRLYDFYAPFVWKVIFRAVNGDRDAAQEILQDTFVSVFHNLRSFSANSALSTWLYRIAFNKAQTYLHRRKILWQRSMELSDAVAGPARSDGYEMREEIERVLAPFTPEERFMLTAVESTGMTFDELSQITGKSNGALRTQIHRIKERIRRSV